MLLISSSFVALARNQANILGMPAMPTVVLPHPLGGTPLASVLAKLDAVLPEIIAKLTTPMPVETTAAEAGTSSIWLDVETSDEWYGLQCEFTEHGWGDGLPLVPPTETRVAAMVGGAGVPKEHIIGVVAPSMGVATAELIAANAVMAGCRPQHMPVLVAAVHALVEPQFNLYGCQTTTHCVAPLLIVSGPLARTLNIHSGSGMFGPGPWSNGVIGRAVRLILLNIGGAKPVEIDKATMGHPGKYTFCIAENEQASPWPTLRAERGFASDVTTVTVIGGEAPHNINDHESNTAGGVLTTVCGAIAEAGQNNVYYKGEPLLILGPEHAATIAAEGFTKDDVKRHIYDNARIPIMRFSQEIIERRFWRRMPIRYRNTPRDTMVTVAHRPEDVMVMVGGGAGKHSMWVPTFGATRSVTRAIQKADGTPWLPSDF